VGGVGVGGGGGDDDDDENEVRGQRGGKEDEATETSTDKATK
jgi:hypothetical protein